MGPCWGAPCWAAPDGAPHLAQNFPCTSEPQFAQNAMDQLYLKGSDGATTMVYIHSNDYVDSNFLLCSDDYGDVGCALLCSRRDVLQRRPAGFAEPLPGVPSPWRDWA